MDAEFYEQVAKVDEAEIDEVHQFYLTEILELRSRIEKGYRMYDDFSNINVSVSQSAIPSENDATGASGPAKKLKKEYKTIKHQFEKFFKLIDEHVQDPARNKKYKLQILHQAILNLDEKFDNIHCAREGGIFIPYIRKQDLPFYGTALIILIFVLIFIFYIICL